MSIINRCVDFIFEQARRRNEVKERFNLQIDTRLNSDPGLAHLLKILAFKDVDSTWYSTVASSVNLLTGSKIKGGKIVSYDQAIEWLLYEPFGEPKNERKVDEDEINNYLSRFDYQRNELTLKDISNQFKQIMEFICLTIASNVLLNQTTLKSKIDKIKEDYGR